MSENGHTCGNCGALGAGLCQHCQDVAAYLAGAEIGGDIAPELRDALGGERDG